MQALQLIREHVPCLGRFEKVASQRITRARRGDPALPCPSSVVFRDHPGQPFNRNQGDNSCAGWLFLIKIKRDSIRICHGAWNAIP